MTVVYFILAIIILFLVISIFLFSKPRKQLNLGIKNYNEGNYESAIGYFDSSIKLNPINANAYMYRGYCNAALGNNKAAVTDYTAGMAKKKPTADDYLNRGALKDLIEDYDGAIEDFTQATYLNESDSDAYYNRGLSNSKKGLIQTAILDWRIAAAFGNERAIKKLDEFDS
jgi:tetratricopeptide (TPR) repeat protein